MKIVSRNENLLTIKDLGISNWIMAIICLVVGAGVLYSQLVTANLITGIVGGLFFAVGLYLVVVNEATTISVDKTEQKIFIKRSRLFSSENESHGFGEITKIILTEHSSRSDRGGRTVSYDIQLVLNNGQHVSFVNNSSTTNSAFAKKKKHVEIAKEVSVFVGVPFEELSTPGLGDVLGIFKQVLDLASKGQLKKPSDSPVDKIDKK